MAVTARRKSSKSTLYAVVVRHGSYECVLVEARSRPAAARAALRGDGDSAWRDDMASSEIATIQEVRS